MQRINWLKTEKGFSLIELMVVVGIMAVMLLMATYGGDFVQRHRLSASTRELLGDLQRARQDALTKSVAAKGRGYGLRFSTNSAYVVFEFNDTDDDFIYLGTGEESGPRQRTLSSAITVTEGASGDPTVNVLIFDKTGVARDQNWNLVNDRTYVLRLPSATAQAHCVKIDQVMLREGIWNGAACATS